jgi:F420-dependent oxidoreductase-like protein
VKFGLRIDDFNWPGGEREMGARLESAGRRAEAAGFDSIWIWDHFVQLRKWEDPHPEGWMALAHLAGVTQRIMLGTHVTGVTYRAPAILVKQATTLDVLSGGRAYLGIGAAWNEREHAAFGVPFPPLRERFEILEETLQVALRAWAGETGPFDGKHIHLTEQIDSPRPVQRPHPPILIGGVGERKTLRLVAQYAQATDMFISDPAEFRHKLDVLRRHCDNLDRPYEQIERYGRIDLSGPDGVELPPGRLAPASLLLDRAEQMARAGADAIVISLPGITETDVIERFGEDVVRPGHAIQRPAAA